MTATRALTAAMLLAAVFAATALGASGGGAFPSTVPTMQSVACTTGCAGITLTRPGSTIVVTGGDLEQVNRIVFLGVSSIPDDDVVAPASPVNGSQVVAVVPAGAVTGHIRVLNADGNSSIPSHGVVRVTTSVPAPTGAVSTQLSAKTVYYDGTDPATLRYFVDGTAPSTVTVTLVHGKNGSAVQAWGPTTLAVGDVGMIGWIGTAATGASAGSGKYTFKISVTGGGARAVTTPTPSGTFTFLPDVFPVVGAHHFNMTAGRFGAGRSGHTHQGQDVMASCGLPLVAARGGTVAKVAVDGNAGNYVVIHTDAGAPDMFYAHLREPSPLKEGDEVKSGQAIGVVGRTGDATACHLHFEEWTQPGWYKGGHPIDPLPDLRRWDAAAKLAKQVAKR